MKQRERGLHAHVNVDEDVSLSLVNDVVVKHLNERGRTRKKVGERVSSAGARYAEEEGQHRPSWVSALGVKKVTYLAMAGGFGARPKERRQAGGNGK